MKEQLKRKYEIISKEVAETTIITLINSQDFEKAKDFAKEVINNWQKEGKETMILDFEKLLTEKGIEIED